MKNETIRQIEESYNHIKPYLKICCPELEKMCSKCEKYCGKEHDYEECKDEICFKFFLAFEYLEWLNSYGGIE